MLKLVFSLCILVSVISAGVESVISDEDEYPLLRLPWGTWKASKYDDRFDFFTFTNVRFGKEPNCTMRFGRSERPSGIPDSSVIQSSSYGPSCIQVDITKDCTPGGDFNAPHVIPPIDGKTSEDCLFLDIYVPASAFEPDAEPLPVVVWIFGGAYVFGSKNDNSGLPLYNATGILSSTTAGKKPIFVSGNYRLGTYGWLAGSTMENAGQPNAGLWDQRLLLEWVRDYIELVGGDPNDVSVWGESAGAGSIMHHLMRYDGKQDPLFKKAILQSPAFQWQWDRSGMMEDVYNQFVKLLSCDKEKDSMQCIRERDPERVADANQRLFQKTLRCTGLYPVGPSLDGDMFNTLPPQAFSTGAHWKGIQSLIISHVADESSMFIPKYIHEDDPKTFEEFLVNFFAGENLVHIRDKIRARYSNPPLTNQTKRTGLVIRDPMFTCNTRYLYNAYHGDSTDTYMMEYNMLQLYGLAIHGADLLPLYWNKDVDVAAMIKGVDPNTPDLIANTVAGIFKKFAPAYQSYFVSHAITGNPNTFRGAHTKNWAKATTSRDGNQVQNVLSTQWNPFIIPAKYFKFPTTDSINTNKTCQFWLEIAQDAMDATGVKAKSDYVSGSKEYNPGFKKYTLGRKAQETMGDKWTDLWQGFKGALEL